MRLLTAIVVVLALSGPASAAEVRSGGALDIVISGFARFLVAYGDIDKKANFDPPGDASFEDLSTFDFRNDTEVHIVATVTHDATGIEYGGTIEFEADTFGSDQDRTEGGERLLNANTDETWIFVRGGLGELRAGDTDSASNALRVGADAVAVGTGGIDGTVVNIDQVVNVDFDRTAEDRTKIVYYSPVFAGLQFGISYQPDSDRGGDSLAFAEADERDHV
jgi:outer membrane protein OmpU